MRESLDIEAQIWSYRNPKFAYTLEEKMMENISADIQTGYVVGLLSRRFPILLRNKNYGWFFFFGVKVDWKVAQSDIQMAKRTEVAFLCLDESNLHYKERAWM